MVVCLLWASSLPGRSSRGSSLGGEIGFAKDMLSWKTARILPLAVE